MESQAEAMLPAGRYHVERVAYTGPTMRVEIIGGAYDGCKVTIPTPIGFCIGQKDLMMVTVVPIAIIQTRQAFAEDDYAEAGGV